MLSARWPGTAGSLRAWRVLETYIHQAEAWHDLVVVLAPRRRVCSCRAARIDEKLVHILEALEAVGATPA